MRNLCFRWDQLGERERLSLSGLLAHCSSVEPDFIAGLVRKYGRKGLG
ncbi:MAG: hypothetical protein V2A74_05590 [bacterium]